MSTYTDETYDGPESVPSSGSWGRADAKARARVGRYYVLSQLGAGAMGVVYAAYSAAGR